MAGAAKYISAAGKVFFPSLLWNIKTTSKTLYLTFDDGPVPGITPWVISLLKDYNAKATFFSTGENIAKNPEVFDQILAEGHSVGNHTYNHLNGWKTSTENYLENVSLAEAEFSKHMLRNGDNYDAKNSAGNNSKLFRPPYGKITPKQLRGVEKAGYKIVMWDVISYDFENSFSAETCYGNVIDNAVPGSIIVFHDSLKASGNLKNILPKVLEYYDKKGFKFRSL